ncbi:hypothetical protein KBC04_00850 [Candidatus Babeliales bacterium]|nr:hypothetical protein [Candidatus Babeliales bacterium]MBP9843360.1 hypothetical protein [Candidatus Babeliales bacterium]
MKRIIVAFIILLTSVISFCNPGNLDTSFNQASINGTIPGTAVVNLTTAAPSQTINSSANGIALQTDGKVVIAGYGTYPTAEQLAVARFLPDGTLDTTFNAGGTPGYNTIQLSGASESVATAIAIDYASDNIIITGYALISGVYKVFVARYLPDGTFDTTFNTNGFVELLIPGSATGCKAYGLCIQANSNIIIVGEYNTQSGIFIARILGSGGSAGTLDTTGFGSPHGYATLFTGIDSGAIAVGVDPITNKFIVAGFTTVSSIQQFFVARYTTTGLLDTIFTNPTTPYGTNGQGYTTTDISGGAIAYALSVKGDGTALVAGNNIESSLSPYPIALAQFTPQGLPDVQFNQTGIVLTQIIGDEDSISAFATGVSTDNNGKIVVAGNVNFTSGQTDTFFARYNANGSLDTTLTREGYIIPSINNGTQSNGLALELDGKAITTGYTILESSNIQMIVIRMIGGALDNQATSSISQYGFNSQFLSQFLYPSFYVTVISDPAVQSATLDALNTIIENYSADYSIQPDFNYIAYLYLLQTELDRAQAQLLDLYGITSGDEINLCFTYIQERVYQLIQPS